MTRQLLLLLCFALFLLFQLSSTTFVDQYVAYGNALHTADVYFNYSSHLLDEQTFFNEMFQCSALTINKLYSCIRSTVVKYRDSSQLWSPDVVNRKPDCTYNLQPKSHVLVSNPSVTFGFQIAQSQCRNNVTYQGGSSFEVFAITANDLIACSVVDHLNDHYQVSCHITCWDEGDCERRLQLVAEPSMSVGSGSAMYCVNVTVLLTDEHFDSHSERHTLDYFENGLAPPKYLVYRHILIDNQRYCFSAVSRAQNHSHQMSNFNVSNQVTYYGGSWRERNASLESVYMYKYVGSHIQAYEVVENLTSIRDSSFKPQLTDVNLTLALQNRYQFVPVEVGETGSRALLRGMSNASLVLKNESHRFQFLGASHMRFFYDSTLMYVFGDDVLNGQSTHHSDFTMRNFAGHTNVHSPDSIFADDQSDFLINYCHGLSSDTSHNHTFVFQTGAWDLSIYSLRRLVRSTNSAQRLTNTVKSILEGTLACPNLKHLVWLTAIPHPVCYSDVEIQCNGGRNHRTTDNIAALNTFYMNGFLSSKIRPGIQLSIVDVYSIIKPRLALNELVDAVGTHYLSRRAGSESTLVHTIGADAVLEALLRALVSGM